MLSIVGTVSSEVPRPDKILYFINLYKLFDLHNNKLYYHNLNSNVYLSASASNITRTLAR